MEPARRLIVPAYVDAAEPARLDAAWRHDVRMRALGRRPHRPAWARRLRQLAWILAVVLHLFVIAVLRVRSPIPIPPVRETTISVDLLAAPAAPLPQSRPPPLPHRPDATRAQAPHATARERVAPAAPAPEPPALRLFREDGGAIVPDDLVERIDRARPRPDFIPLPVEPSPILQDKRPLKVRPNHFAQYWNGTDGRPLHETMWRYVTVTKQLDMPWGGRWGCAWILIVVACGDVPEKAWNPPQTWRPATELDER